MPRLCILVGRRNDSLDHFSLPAKQNVLISQGRQAIVGWLEIGRYEVKLGKTYQVELRERELKGPKLPGGRSQPYRRAVVELIFG